VVQGSRWSTRTRKIRRAKVVDTQTGRHHSRGKKSRSVSGQDLKRPPPEEKQTRHHFTDGAGGATTDCGDQTENTED